MEASTTLTSVVPSLGGIPSAKDVLQSSPSGWALTNPLVLVNIILRILIALLKMSVNSATSWAGSMLGRRFSITLRVSSVVIGVAILVALVWAYVRYRFLTRYSRLQTDREDDRSANMWLEDDDEPHAAKPTYTTYFDEFLSAIQVFGYLDRKVFLDLTRHIRTHRIDAGESVRLKDLDGFAMVIEGSVQVYAKDNEKTDKQDGSNYQLLNEVNRAAPISSLFSILSLFTEDVKLNESLSSRSKLDNDEEVPDLDLQNEIPPKHTDEVRQIPSDFDEFNDSVVAVGKTGTTIAVIPSQAFRDLTQRYPAQTANIVQIILLRWSRVTIRTSRNYLDLTWQIYETERLLNQVVRRQLPSWLREGAVHRLRLLSKQNPDEKIVSLEKRRKGNYPGNAAGGQYQSRNLSLEHSLDQGFPGDLLSNVPLSRTEPIWGNIRNEMIQAGLAADSRKPSLAHSLQSIESILNKAPTTRSRRDSFETQNESIPRRFDRQNSFIVPPDGLGAYSQLDRESEDSTLRRALVEELFGVLGFDSTMKTAMPSSRGSSVMGSVPNSPMNLPQTGTGLNFTAAFSERQSDSTSMDGDTSVFPQSSFETILEQAAEFVEVALFKEGELLSKEETKAEGIFYVLDGTLRLEHTSKGSTKELSDVNPGGIAGYVETVTSYSSFVTIRAKTDVCVAKLSKQHFEKLADRYPLLYISVAKTMISMLSRPIILLDFALEWLNISSGETLFRKGDEADAIYFVLNGRLRTLAGDTKGKHEALGEFGQGSSVGQLEVLLGDKYQSTAIAVRETELARFPRVLVESLAQNFPKSTFELARIVASEVMSRLEQPTHTAVENIHTVSILPTVEGLPVEDFAIKLAAAFRANGRDIAVLSNATVLAFLGRYAFSRLGILKLKTHLADLEQQHETIIYIADTGPRSQWTRTCVDQADCVLLLAAAATTPTFGDYERLLVKSKSSARAHLVLLHKEKLVEPGSTSLWLKNRPWVSRHHHVRMDFELQSPIPKRKERLDKKSLKKLRQLKDIVQEEIFHKTTKPAVVSDHNKYPFKNDFGRIARILSGEAVGLVLGGGGARGISHIGVLRALEEAGIPVDMVGGTSIGSFVGGLYARDHDMVTMYGRAKKFAGRMSSLWRMLLDITYPTTSYTTGHEFNRGIWKAFGDSRIEDFWVKYFNNTTNLTHSRMDIHESGYAWRYIRASMSLAGLVPPIEDKGQMLLDGGYMDNLPVTEMLKQGAKHIIAVDVGSVDDTTPILYGDTLSGLWVMINRWNPFSNGPKLPNLAEIQARLAYVSSVKALEVAKASPGVLYMRPPIDSYATLDFGKFDEIMAVGYAYAAKTLRQLAAEDKLPKRFNENGHKNTRTMKFRRHSI